MHKTMQTENSYKIDMWHGDKFVPQKFHADASFYPHKSFGFVYRGNIYDDAGNMIGDYSTNDSVWIEDNFIIGWR